MEEYASKITSYNQISKHASQIYAQFCNPDVISDSRNHHLLAELELAKTEPNDVAVQRSKSTTSHSGAKLKKASTKKAKQTDAKVAAPRAKVGDSVFENAVLFNRDSLISRELTDAIKVGDSGQVVLCLKVLALDFRGSGRTKYAYEMLHLIHNLTNVWPDSIRSVQLINLSSITRVSKLITTLDVS